MSETTQQPTLESPRLRLRPFEASDADRVQTLAGDVRVADTTAVIPHPYPDGVAQAWIAMHPAEFLAKTCVNFAITLRDSNVLIGAVSLMGISSTDARAALGYWLGVDYWGAGYCTEAVCRAIQFAHEQLGTTRITACCFARNPASARVMEKAGLNREGMLPQHMFKNGRYEDMLLYGLNLPGRSL